MHALVLGRETLDFGLRCAAQLVNARVFGMRVRDTGDLLSPLCINEHMQGHVAS